MAKKKPDEQPELITVIAGARFKHDGNYVKSGDRLRMSAADAADLKALRFVRYATPDEAA